MKQYFMGNWSDKEDVASDFSIDISEFDNTVILLAYYSYEDYSGSAFVWFERNNKLYEVNGSHCSCSGLENQWDPDDVTVGELYHRITKGNMMFSDEIKQLLKLYKQRQARKS